MEDSQAPGRFKVSGMVTFSREDRDIDRTTTIEIKEVGSTRINVPDETRNIPTCEHRAAWKNLSAGRNLVLIAGPCVIESEKLCFEVASTLQKLCNRAGINYVFKASFDKANRTSGTSFRGPGIQGGLEALEKVRRKFDLPVLTDIHTGDQAVEAGKVVDVLQIPA